MHELYCKICYKKKIIWQILECNVESPEECPCWNCLVITTCKRLCSSFNGLKKLGDGRCELRRYKAEYPKHVKVATMTLDPKN